MLFDAIETLAQRLKGRRERQSQSNHWNDPIEELPCDLSEHLAQLAGSTPDDSCRGPHFHERHLDSEVGVLQRLSTSLFLTISLGSSSNPEVEDPGRDRSLLSPIGRRCLPQGNLLMPEGIDSRPPCCAGPDNSSSRA